MSSFIGSETSVIDVKGRITVPARLRKGLDPNAADTFTIIRGFDGSVHMYPLDEWRHFEESLRGLSKGDDEARGVFLLLMETACEATIDSQGRVLLTPGLLELAGLERTARLVGVLDHIEIWSPERFAAQVKKATPGFEAMMKNVFSRLRSD